MSKENVRSMLKLLYIVQVRDHPVTGKIDFRLHPYNPLAYLMLIVVLAEVLITNGINGIRYRIWRNPFRWISCYISDEGDKNSPDDYEEVLGV